MVLYGFWRGDRPNTIRLPTGSAWYLYERPKPNRKSTIWPACVLGVLDALAWRLIRFGDTAGRERVKENIGLGAPGERFRER